MPPKKKCRIHNYFPWTMDGGRGTLSVLLSIFSFMLSFLVWKLENYPSYFEQGFGVVHDAGYKFPLLDWVVVAQPPLKSKVVGEFGCRVAVPPRLESLLVFFLFPIRVMVTF
jgi:hypothetical protein